jgi:hypothetical protein
MRKVLAKFIEHNQSRQNIFEKQKIFYKQDFKAKNHLRSRSDPRLDQRKKENKEKETIDNSNTDGKATIGSSVILEEEKHEEKSN